jgi:hypothetical protein
MLLGQGLESRSLWLLPIPSMYGPNLSPWASSVAYVVVSYASNGSRMVITTASA